METNFNQVINKLTDYLQLFGHLKSKKIVPQKRKDTHLTSSSAILIFQIGLRTTKTPIEKILKKKKS